MAFVRSRKRKGGTFWFVVDRHGNERRCGAGREGEKAARRWQGRLEQAEWAELRGEPIETVLGASWTLQTLRDRDVEASAGKASLPSRRRRWKGLLEAFGVTTTLDRLTPALIQAFATERRRSVSAQTVRNDLSLLSSALKLARRMRHESRFTANPFADILRPTGPSRPVVALPASEAKKVIAAAWAKAAKAPAHLADLWRDNAAMIELAYETSSRISQILTLRRDQVAGGLLRFPSHKGGIPREFPVSGRIGAVLRRIPDRGVYFFPARAGAKKKAHRDNLAAFWRAIAPAGFTLHGLRHSAATAALYAGESLPAVALRLGHRDLTMVQRRYGHIFRAPIPALPRATGKTAVTTGGKRHPRASEPGKSGNSGRSGEARILKLAVKTRPAGRPAGNS